MQINKYFYALIIKRDKDIVSCLVGFHRHSKSPHWISKLLQWATESWYMSFPTISKLVFRRKLTPSTHMGVGNKKILQT